MIKLTYQNFPGEVIILGLPAFIKFRPPSKKVMFDKTSPVTKIHPNGDFETKNGFLCKRT
jgi:hypothetical protein